MGRAHTVGVTVAILFVASLIVAFALAQPASHRLCRATSGGPERSAARESPVQDLKEVNYYPADGKHTYMSTRFHPAAIDRDFDGSAPGREHRGAFLRRASVFGSRPCGGPMADRLSEVIGLAAITLAAGSLDTVRLVVPVHRYSWK